MPIIRVGGIRLIERSASLLCIKNDTYKGVEADSLYMSIELAKKQTFFVK
jgi:hypothetical protein